MDWVNNLFLVLLLTDITGTIFFLAELLLRKWTKLDARFTRFLTMVSLGAYLMPIVYFVLYAGRWFSMAGSEEKVNLFYQTPLTQFLNTLGGFIWIGLFLVLLARRLVRCFRWKWICRGNIPEEDEVVFKVFRDVCAELGIKGRMSVCMNDSVTMPCITYDHGYTVVMPLWRYTEEEARVIFYHELCHFRNGDLIIKTIGSIVTLLHVFNPAAHYLFKQMKVDCEKYCDRVACEKGTHMFTDSEYFQVILNLSSEDGKRNRYQLFTLAEGRSDCERRVEYMSEYQKHGRLKRVTAITLSACFLLGSSTTSLAAGNGVLSIYEKIADWSSIKNTYENSSADSTVDNMTEISPDGMMDIVAEISPDSITDIAATEDAADEEIKQILSREYDIDPEDVVMMGDDGIELYGLFYNSVWKIPAGKTYVSSGFRQSEGDYVILTVAGEPDDIDYEMGIKDPDCIMWYVEGSGDTHQRFDIVMNGRHYFYIKNLSEDQELCADITLNRHIAGAEETE